MKIKLRSQLLTCIILLLSLSTLAACGYSTPTGGVLQTPYIVIVTPTPSYERLTVNAQATFQALPTATPLPTATAGQTPIPTTPIKSTPASTPTLSVSGDVYVVQAGDTLTGIAVRLKVDVDDLIAVNNLNDPNALLVGQKLKIPPRVTPTPTR